MRRALTGKGAWICWGVPGVLAGILLWAGCRGVAEVPRHLLLITVDTLRADRLGAYGGELGLTPHLDALARRSEVFDRAYAPTAFTLPSISAVMTGRYPQELGIWKNESGLPDSVATLADELRRRGWRTAAVVSNFVLREKSGLAAGFELFDDTLPQREAVRKWPERIAADTTSAALNLLDACLFGADARCFLWVHYQDPHGPYTPPVGRRARFLEAERNTPDGRRLLPVHSDEAGVGGIPSYQFLDGNREVAFYRAGYDAEIDYMDEEVGRLLDGLEQRDLTDRTVIVFAADHGEGLGEDDYWFSHGALLTDPLVRVPLLIRDPGRSPQRRGDLVSLVDIFPTLLSLLVDAPVDPDGSGRDLLGEGAEREASTAYLATLGAARVQRYGVVDGAHKLVVSERDGVIEERFSRSGDERVDLAAETPELAAELREKLSAFREKMKAGPPEVRQQLSPEEREKLRALGYVTDP